MSTATTRHAFWFTTRGYALRSTLRRLVHRKLASLTTLGVMSLSLTLPVLLFLLLPDMLRVTAASTSSPGLVAYLDTNLSDIEGARLATSIEQRADVQDADYVSKADALAEPAMSDALVVRNINAWQALCAKQTESTRLKSILSGLSA